MKMIRGGFLLILFGANGGFSEIFWPPSAAESTCPHPPLWSPQTTTPSGTSRPLTSLSLVSRLARLFGGRGLGEGGAGQDREKKLSGEWDGAKFPLN